MIPVAVIIRTKNEAARLPRCINSLQNAFAEVFVVDSRSPDGTADIARAHGARVIDFDWNGKYPKKSQWCLENVPATSDWFLYLDADEVMTPGLIVEMKSLLTTHSSSITFSAFWIAGDPVWQGQRLRRGQSNQKISLFRRGCAFFPSADDLDTPMGEIEGHYQPAITGRIGRLQNRILHHCDPLPEWFRRHVRYAETTAMMQGKDFLAHETGFRAACKKLFYKLPLQGALIFLYGYIWRLGFLDGRAGLDYALARAWYYELTALFCRRNSR